MFNVITYNDLFDSFFFNENKNLKNYEVLEEKDKIKILAEVPGINKEDLTISLENKTLKIKGEGKRKDYSFSFKINEGIDDNRIEAKLENGILQIDLWKKENEKARKIDVT